MIRNIICPILCWCFLNCTGQRPFGSERLRPEKEIALPQVKGRIDHMAFNPRDTILYVAALGNNTVEAIDLIKGSVIKHINGVEEPQGIAYIPEQNEIAVASGATGDCVFFQANSFEKSATIHLPGDADNVRYDARERKLYVGYGNGGLAMIDPVAHKQIKNVKLPAHPESFQLNQTTNKLYVNLPDDHSIAVIDLKRFEIIDTWKTNTYGANFPMTLDTTNNIVFVGYRHPALLVGYDRQTGKQISATELIGDVDDIFYNAGGQEVLASGGGGAINVFKRESRTVYRKVANIPTRHGARTSLLIPSLQRFVLAERANGGKVAAIAVYKINE